MFRVNQLVIVNGYVCAIKEINNGIYYLRHIDGSEIVVKESQIYTYLGGLCLTTFLKIRNKNLRNNRLYKGVLFIIFLSVTFFINMFL